MRENYWKKQSGFFGIPAPPKFVGSGFTPQITRLMCEITNYEVVKQVQKQDRSGNT
jgi:hypothetical protein